MSDSHEPLSDSEISALREIVQDFDRAKWLRGQVKWWVIWLLGLPTALVTLWTAMETLLKKVGVR